LTERARLLAWEGCYNARDVGGYAAADGRQVRWGALLRSDNLCQLTGRGREQLIEAGITTVIDLRSANELEIDPPPYGANTAEGAVPRYLNIPVLDYDDQETIARLAWAMTTTGRDYCVMLDGFRRHFGRVLQAIADARPGGVLVHCHAGKDRTGLVVALLLSLAGVPNEVVVADYAASQQHLQRLVEERLRSGLSAMHIGSPPGAMVELLTWLEREHGGAMGYMRAAGLDDDAIVRLRERLIE
jgi:protein-tyrosine phosphatase